MALVDGAEDDELVFAQLFGDANLQTGAIAWVGTELWNYKRSVADGLALTRWTCEDFEAFGYVP